MESREKPEISPFDSAPPSQESNITNLSNTLSDENEKMFQRMRALFALRNIGGHESVDALTNAFNSESALLKHEIAYVLGQMQDPHAVPSLIDRLSDTTEDVMVRHEAAEALGAIGDMIAIDTLRKYQDDSEVVVAESCEVAIDLLNYVSSKELNYS